MQTKTVQKIRRVRRFKKADYLQNKIKYLTIKERRNRRLIRAIKQGYVPDAS